MRCLREALLLLLSVTAALAAPPFYHPSLPPQDTFDGFGVQVRFTEPPPGDLEKIAHAGCKWIRTELSWADTERTAGVYDFAAYDHLAAALEEQKLRVVFSLAGEHPAYRAGADRPAAFARWAVAAVSHFRGRGYLWEIGDGPNRTKHPWEKRDPAEFIALARAACEALRAAGLAPTRGGEALIGPGLEGFDLPFLEACFQAGLLEYWSGVSVQPRLGTTETALEEGYRSVRLLRARYGEADRSVPVLASRWGSTDPSELSSQLLVNLANAVPLTIWGEWRRPAGEEDPAQSAPLADAEEALAKTPRLTPLRPLPELLAGFRFSKELVAHTVQSNESRVHVMLFSNGREERLAIFARGEASDTAPQWDTSDAYVYVPASHGLFKVLRLPGGLPDSRVAAGDEGILFDASGWAPLLLIPEERNDFLQVAAASPRLPLEYVYHWPVERAYGDFTADPAPDPFGVDAAREVHRRGVYIAFINPLPREIKNVNPYFSSAVPFEVVGPGETYSAMHWCDQRRDRRHEETFELWVGLKDGQKLQFTQRTTLVCTNPLTVELFPAAKGFLPMHVGNPGGEAVQAHLQISISPSISGDTDLDRNWDFSLAAGERDKLVKLPLSTPLPIGEIYLSIVQDLPTPDGTRADLQRTLPAMDSLPAWTATEERLVTEGDASAAKPAILTDASPPEGHPASETPCVKVEYHFAKDVKNFRLVGPPLAVAALIDPAECQRPVHPRAFGVWVYGDGKGGVPGLRLVDATGQLFQITGRRIDWTGWRFITLPLPQKDDTCPCGQSSDGTRQVWGGERDGAAHYPLYWDTRFLLENRDDRKVSGEIYLSGPTLLYGGSSAFEHAYDPPEHR